VSDSEHMHYLGCLGLLGEYAVYVPEDLREMIEQAMEGACEINPHFKWRRVLNRIEIEARATSRGDPTSGAEKR